MLQIAMVNREAGRSGVRDVGWSGDRDGQEKRTVTVACFSEVRGSLSLFPLRPHFIL